MDGSGALSRDEVATLAQWTLHSFLKNERDMEMTPEQEDEETTKLMAQADEVSRSLSHRLSISSLLVLVHQGSSCAIVERCVSESERTSEREREISASYVVTGWRR